MFLVSWEEFTKHLIEATKELIKYEYSPTKKNDTMTLQKWLIFMAWIDRLARDRDFARLLQDEK